MYLVQLEIGCNLPEPLNIDLLDAPIANEFKWIVKEALKKSRKHE